MEILINDCPVELQIEGGKTISDVIASVSKWTGERNLVFYEFYIDDERYSLEGAPDLGVDRVKVINCIVRSRPEMVISSADEAARYCERANTFIDRALESGEWESGEIGDLVSGITWLLDVLDVVSGLLGLKMEDTRFRDGTVSDLVRDVRDIGNALAALSGTGEGKEVLAGGRGLFADIVQVLRMFMVSDEMRSLIVQSIDSPDVLLSVLDETREELKGQLVNIQTAAVAYQAGKDATASERLGEFIDFIYRYIRTCHQIAPVFRIDLSEIEINGVTMERKNRDVSLLLNEVSAALEQNDIISLSDILEYEIAPALDSIGDYINLLLGRIRPV